MSLLFDIRIERVLIVEGFEDEWGGFFLQYEEW
jgi:hypothetical protein